MRTRLFTRPGVLVFLAPAIAATVLLGACGDDDDEATSASTEAPAATDAPATTEAAATTASGGDLDAFCTAAVDIEVAAAQGEEGPDPATLLPFLADLQANAPEAAQAPLAEIVPMVEAAAESGDAGVFETPEFNAPLAEYHTASVEACGWESTAVDMQDYHFMGLPESLTAGVHSFELTNSGEEPHVLDIFRKNDGVTESFEELLALPEEEAMTKVTMVGSGFAAPGDSGYVVADLGAGEYLAMCPLPVGWVDMSQPPPDGPPHFTQGMAHEFTIS